MFKILPIQSKDEQIMVAKACGAEYREGFFAYSMREADTEELMGFTQFEITSECGYISDIRPVPNLNDFEAMFILGRATMNFIDMCGQHTAKTHASSGDLTLLLSLGFKNTESGELIADMSHMFNGECHHK
ncbi:MAG: hypothetical protein IKC87_08300 [Clostridia bacterium]|nr:hypothetical protein [Clostridia bacterium]